MASADSPLFTIIAGPNGSGKSTAYTRLNIAALERSFWIINPDLLTARIRDVEGLALSAANLAAVQRIELWLEASIKAHQSIGVETVLSTPKYRKLVEQAKKLGFEVRLVYVVLNSPQLNVERVRKRVKEGGHDVPKEKILERYTRSLAQLPWFLEKADRAWLYDNSDDKDPRLIGEKLDGIVTLAANALPEIVEAVDQVPPG